MRLIVLLAGLLLATPVLAQQRIDRPGTVTHEPARAAFPEQIGEFRRANVVSYGTNGDNVSASYNLIRDGQRLLITIYIYPARNVAEGPGTAEAAHGARVMACQSEFQGVNEAVSQAHSNARPLTNDMISGPPGARTGLAHRSIFRLRANFEGRVQDIRSEARLYCYIGGDWLVKYRASSSEGMEVAEDIERFIAQGPWPGRAAAAEPRTVAP